MGQTRICTRTLTAWTSRFRTCLLLVVGGLLLPLVAHPETGAAPPTAAEPRSPMPAPRTPAPLPKASTTNEESFGTTIDPSPPPATPALLSATNPSVATLRQAILDAGSGDQLREQGDLPAAREKWLAAVDGFRRAGDSLREAETYNKLVSSYLSPAELLQNPQGSSKLLDYALHAILAGAKTYRQASGEDEDLDPEAVKRADRRFEEARDLWETHGCAGTISLFDDAKRLYHEAHFDLGEAKAAIFKVRCLAEGGDPTTILGALPELIEALNLAENLPLGDATATRYLDARELLGRGQPAEARPQLEEVLERYEQQGDAAQAAQVRLDLGTAYARLGDHTRAKEYMEQALAAFRRSPDAYSLENQGAAHHNLGGLALETGRVSDAIHELESALAIWQAIGRPDREILTLTALGYALGERGDLDRAKEIFEKALALEATLPPNPGAAADLRNNLATVLYRQGRYQEALSRIRQAQELRGRAPLRQLGAAAPWLNLGTLQSVLGQLPEAIEQEDTGAGRAALGGSVGPVSGLDNNRGALLLQGGDVAGAKELLEKALTEALAQGDRSTSAPILGNLGLIALLRGDLENADGKIAAALAQAGEDTSPLVRVRLLYAQAAIRLQRGDLGQAELLAQRGLDLATQARDPLGQILHLFLLSAVQCRRGDLAAAYERVGRLVDLIEGLQSRLSIPELKASFLGRAPFPMFYGLASYLALAVNRPEEAFRFLEQARARALLEQLDEAGPLSHRAATSANPLVAEERSAHARIEVLEARLAALDRPNGRRRRPRTVLLRELDAARRDYTELLARLELEDPAYATLVQPKIVSLEDLQTRVLPEGVTLVEFFVFDAGGAALPDLPVLAWVIDRSVSHPVLLAIHGPQLATRIRDLRLLISNRDDGWREPASELYRQLILPLLPDLHNRRLVLVPHGVLHALPFAALRNPDTGHDLLDDFALSYAPSASALAATIDQARPSSGAVMVFGNPDGSLPFASREAEQVAALYGTTPQIGEEASETRFRAQAGGAWRIHLAVHGGLAPRSPAFTHLDLAPAASDDGHLEVNEILGLDLRATDLVVLSACDTQVGSVTAGDEIPSLARAFLAAGARSVVASLWPVEDGATALLMERFHSGLRQGLGKAEALRRAALAVRSENPQPYDWAAFTLAGSD